MIPKEYEPLVEKLDLRTKDKNIKWERHSLEDDSFECKVGGNRLVIKKYTYEDYNLNDHLGIRLEIKDSLDTLIDFIYATDEEDDISDYEKLYELYAKARRNALNIDDTIASLLTALD